jgi:SNF2 family DNA or RNA helicase
MSQVAKLLARFNKLVVDNQQILYVLSVIYEPINQTNLKNVLDNLGLKTNNNNSLSAGIGKVWREKLIKSDLLVSGNKGLACNPIIVEQITQKLFDPDNFRNIHIAARHYVSHRNSRYYSFNEIATMSRSSLRVALYLNKEHEIWEILDIKNPQIPADSRSIAPLLDICAKPLNRVWLSQRNENVQMQVYVALLNLSCRDNSDQLSLYTQLQNDRQQGYLQHPCIDYALAQQQLLRAENITEELIHAGDHSSQAYILRGWQAFLLGQNDSALQYYEQAIKSLKKQSRKRNIFIPGMGGIFYILALLKRGNSEDLDLIQKQLDNVSKADPYGQMTKITKIICIPAKIRSGQLPEDAAQKLSGGQFQEPYCPFFCALAQYWLSNKVDPVYIKDISQYGQRAYNNGFFWYAHQAALLLRAVAKDKINASFKNCTEVALAAESSPLQLQLQQLIKAQEPWQRALGALEALSPLASGDESRSAVDSGPIQRLAWFVDPNSYELQPKEQKLNKNGKWSKGRAVALKRLYLEGSDMEFVSFADSLIISTMLQESNYSYYGGFNNPSFYLPIDRALLAAIDHPYLYWQDRPEQTLEIKSCEPELHVQKLKTQLKISLQPMPELEYHESLDYAIRESGNNRLEVIRFNEKHLQIANILTAKGLTVPLSAEKQALHSLSAIAPLLTVHSDIAGFGDEAETVDANQQLLLQIQPAGEGLSFSVFSQPLSEQGPLFVPGEGRPAVIAEVKGKKYQCSRDLDQEKNNSRALLTRCPSLHAGVCHSSNEWLVEDCEQALSVLQELQVIDDESISIQWPQGQSIKLRAPSDVKQMQVSVRQQRDWFAIEGELDIGDDEVLQLQHLMGLLEQSPGRFIKLQEGEFIALTQTLQQRLSDLNKYSNNGTFHPLASPVMDDLTEGMQVISSKPWKQQCKLLEQAYALQPELPSTLQAQLRDYQLEGFTWLARLSRWGAGACLADDMGLGKTMQALALILTRAPKGPTLVLAPTSVCFNWQEEARRFAPTLNVQNFGTGDRVAMLDQAKAFDVIICSYGLLQTESERLQAVQWHTLIADEAQALKNPQTKRSKAAMGLNADFKMIATGTPIENHLGELWNLFNFINPGLLGSLEDFNQQFASPIENHKDRSASLQLKQLIQPFILRRLKSDVLTELPSRTEITVHVEPSKEEQAFYEALRRNALEKLAETEGSSPGQQRMKMLAEIMRLRRACCHPQLVMPESHIGSAKLAAFGDILDELLENRHKALVFSQFVGHLSIIKDYLGQRGISYQYLDGSTPAKQRQKHVNAFQSGEGDLFLISLKAGGSGLNLTAADYVIHMDPWWNPAVEDQASDRAHRMGQKRPVTIYRMVTQGTIEDKIVEMHQQKRDLASQLLEGTEVSGKISLDEMMNLIKGV